MLWLKKSCDSFVYLDETWINQKYIIPKWWVDTNAIKATGISSYKELNMDFLIMHIKQGVTVTTIIKSHPWNSKNGLGNCCCLTFLLTLIWWEICVFVCTWMCVCVCVCTRSAWVPNFSTFHLHYLHHPSFHLQDLLVNNPYTHILSHPPYTKL